MKAFTWKDILTNETLKIERDAPSWNMAEKDPVFISWAIGRIIKRVTA